MERLPLIPRWSEFDPNPKIQRTPLVPLKARRTLLDIFRHVLLWPTRERNCAGIETTILLNLRPEGVNES